jgi:phosphoglycolate phosphatase
LETATGIALARQLYAAMGYDEQKHTVVAGSPLAIHSMAELYQLCGKVAVAAGASPKQALQAVNEAWFVPDPVTMARPLADLLAVFSALRDQEIMTAVATSDDRKSTLATLDALGIAALVNRVVTADVGLPNKPAPDMLLHVCNELGVFPANSVMVGDSLADMQAAQNARFGLRVAVLSGVSKRQQFDGAADAIVENVGMLIK